MEEFLFQLLNVHGVNNVRQTEMHTATYLCLQSLFIFSEMLHFFPQKLSSLGHNPEFGVSQSFSVSLDFFVPP